MSKEERSQIELLLDENNTENLKLYDENNKETEFEQVAVIPMNEKVYAILKQSFRPEFLNRLDEIIMFSPLIKSQIGKIVDLLLLNVSKRLEVKQLSLDVTTKAKELVIEQGYDVSFGARPLKRFIQHTIETMIAKTLLKEDIKPNSTIVIDAVGDELEIRIKK